MEREADISIAEIVCRDDIKRGIWCKCSKDFMVAGQKRLAGNLTRISMSCSRKMSPEEHLKSDYGWCGFEIAAIICHMIQASFKNIMSHAISLIQRLVNAMSRPQRRAVQIVFDGFVLGFCVWLAFQFRLGFGHNFTDFQIIAIAIAPFVGIPIFIRFGLYRAVLRYLPDMALWTIIYAVGLTTLGWVAAIFVLGFYGGDGVPRSIPPIFGVLLFSITLVSRFAAKQVIYWEQKPNRTRYAIYGAGAAGLQYTQALLASSDAEVCALFDDDEALHGNEYHGVRVYPPSQIGDMSPRLGIKNIVICMPSVHGRRRLEIAASLSKLPLKVQTLPSMAALFGGKYTVEPSADLDLNELLGRSPVPPNFELMTQSIAGKTVLVTGAGGSIGSQLVDTLATYGAATVIMVDHAEFALFEVDRQMRERNRLCLTIPILASVTDAEAMEKVFKAHRPHLVFHAAAYKHVALAERNTRAVFQNNVLGTQTMLQAAANSSMETFVLISTDKAVNPSSVMGATKRFAELLVRQHAEKAQNNQCFSSVRFGNVIGSQGSVIPIFKDQIKKGGPVRVRGRDTTRYFMATSEACELIIQSAGLARGGETFMLQMGEPISIYTLAHNMIELSGLAVKDANTPDGDIEIVVTNMEQGEKIAEQLFYDPSSSEPTIHSKIVRAKRRTNAHLYVEQSIDRIREVLPSTSDENIRSLIFDALRECQRDILVVEPAKIIPLKTHQSSSTRSST